MRNTHAILAALLLGACATTSAPKATKSSAGQVREVLPFLHDDYESALALAKERGVPLFVDAWAPWCHTCRSMNETVFTDQRLATVADRFVWLSIDTEKAQNAGFLERHPQQVWPTLLVIDPKSERAVLRWLGSGTVEQLEALLADGERAARGGATGADALLARADRLYAEGKASESAEVLEEALREAPAGWPRRSRAVESLLMAKAFGGEDDAGCAKTALAELQQLRRSPSWANVAALGLYCALEAPQSTAWREEVIEPLEGRVREALGPPRIAMAVDDRSGLYDALASARQAAGDEAGAKAVAGEWLAFLEDEAARASTPQERTVYDAHRMVAALILGEPERVLGALQESERDLPGDYNPPARLAVIYLQLGRLDEALAASDRALAKVYGPRKVRVLNDRGDILVKRGAAEGARAAYQEALTLGESLPASQQPRRELERSRSRLASLPAPR